MVEYVRPYRNKLIGVLIALFFSGPGVMFYINFWRGVIASIIEIYAMIVLGPLPGLVVGSFIAVIFSWSKLEEYEERYKRVLAYKKVKDTLHEDADPIDRCSDAMIIITNPNKAKELLKKFPQNNVVYF